MSKQSGRHPSGSGVQWGARKGDCRGALVAGIVGAGAGELIAEGVLAIEMAALASDVKLSIHPHPTLSETIMESAEVFFGQSTHLYRPKKG